MPGIARRQAGISLKVGLSRRKAEHEVSTIKEFLVKIR
jgi:hypothetical protein